MNNSLVSIIIPTYNRVDLIGETLDSVIAQTYTNWECIVVDDGSTDYTEELLEYYCERDNRIKYVLRPKNLKKGANSCRNYGFQISNGDFINWFDDDDLMHPDKLKIQKSILEIKSCNFIICQSLVFEGKLENVLGLRHEKIQSLSPLEDYIQQKIVWLTQSPMFKRKFLEELGELFNVHLQAAQEWEFFCRVLSESPIYCISNVPLVYLRKHEKSISYNKNWIVRELNYFKARTFVYMNESIQFNNNSKEYLRNYLGIKFKYLIRNGQLGCRSKLLVFSFINFKNYGFKFRSKILFTFLSYTIFNRGEFILKGVRF